jgi:hypothetical protein
MRTKTLLLTAALSAAGIVSSMAQAGAVYSVNAVGYVNTDLAPGFNLVSNPLIASDNTIGKLFAGLPIGTQVYKYAGAAGFVTATMDEFSNDYEPAEARNTTVVPGEGVFVRNPTATAQKVTFVGEVAQGAASNQTVPAGLSIRSSAVPQEGTAADLGFPAVPGDQIFQFNPATQAYISSQFDEFTSTWQPALTPLKVGEAFFVSKVTAGAWNRNFSVNQ